MTSFSFKLHAQSGAARTGIIQTAHGPIRTPAFMPVGTAGTVKGMLPEQVRAAGADIILGNTYHLMLRPSAEVVAKLGGLHRFMQWDGPILTDSGGFQVMSLAKLRRITESGVTFQSHLDGKTYDLTPERSIEIQHLLGSDITMAFDECTPFPATEEQAAESMRLSMRWAERSRKAFRPALLHPLFTSPSPLAGTYAKASAPCGAHAPTEALAQVGEGREGGRPGARSEPVATPHPNPPPHGGRGYAEGALFGIVQGGMYRHLREESAAALRAMGFDGYAIGGLAVGEGQDIMFEVLDYTAPFLPEDKPRYLMGVGKPSDIVGAVARGVDMFDCVIPTRAGRFGRAYTAKGELNIKNAVHGQAPGSLDETCGCPCCSRYSRAYLHHLFKADEMLGPLLLTLHNLHHYQNLMADIRDSIAAGEFAKFAQHYLTNHE